MMRVKNIKECTMTLIEEQIERHGLKKKFIAQEVGISTRTLTDWIKYNKIDQVMKFTKLLEILNLPLVEVAEEYTQKKD
jgi:ribosome-binding protein aMBF1 (putative translation factor)